MDKLNNLLSFKEYAELKKFDKSTKHTEIGGDVVNEKYSVDNEYLNEGAIGDFFNKVKTAFTGKKLTPEQVIDMLTNPNNPEYDQSAAEKYSNMDDATKDKTVKYFIFKAANPNVRYYGWDAAKKQWVDTGVYTEFVNK